jgi:N-acetylmuramoyl-L-alanine amidase
MLAGQKNLPEIFARVSLGFVLALPVALPAKAKSESAATADVKRHSASAQFAKAEEQREALNAKPNEKRTLADYKQVAASYHRVSLITPRAAEVPDSLLAMADLYVEMGDRFGRNYYQSAVDALQFLVREYPTNKNCQDAMLRMGKLQRDQLGEAALAEKTYDDFLKRYPRSPRKREAQEALAELALLRHSEENEAASKTEAKPPATVVSAEEPAPPAPSVHSGGKSGGRSEAGEIPRVRRIRAAVNGEATRVTIDLEASVQYTSGRIANPDRIFFDLHAARLTPEVARGDIHVEGNLLTAVRVAQNHAGVVRIVLNVKGVKDYTASLTNNPTQLLIDLYGNPVPAGPVRTARSKRGPQQTGGDDTVVSENATGNTGAAQTAAAKNSSEQPAGNAKSAINGSVGGSVAPNGSSAGNNSSAVAQNSASLAGNSAKKSKSSKAAAADAKPDLIQPVTTPQPTRDGQSTLTRTLGLKISRIVIDPGHGGHDTGTIGPTGLMEKDLCLDVALRLGKIIQQRLPGAEVVYTRSDDTFIPLEERTNMANQAKADLFISIHANSSQDHEARGIETYYLNLKGSAEAMEVAARENATAQEGVHDLQDLVKRIAQTEKIEESREFAEDIQDSLAKRIQTPGKAVKNRGVRKAPFVVLIGADMPSILTEISFLSNPADEKLLKRPEQRQKVAEGLYQGVASYLQSMNSVTVNTPARPQPARPPVTAAVEQSRNQR